VLLNLRAVDNVAAGRARARRRPRLAARWQALGRQIGRLDGLVDQLLDVSRITAGKMALAPEPIELGELVREVVGHFSPTFLPETATIDVRAIAPVEGCVDRLRLEQILTNLLSNAGQIRRGRPISVEVGAPARATTRKLDRRPRSRHRHVARASWVGSSGASSAPSPTQLRRPRAGPLDRAPGGRRHGRQHLGREPARPRVDVHACGYRAARASGPGPLTEPATARARGSSFAMGRIFETRKATMFKRWDKMAKAFTRIGKDIAIAVKAGGPSPTQPALRRVIQNARAANMPKDKIENAIKKASGQGPRATTSSCTKATRPTASPSWSRPPPTTSCAPSPTCGRRSRPTAAAMGTEGSVAFQFKRMGVFRLSPEALAGKDLEALELDLIDHGLEEMGEGTNDKGEPQTIIRGAFADFGKLQAAIEARGVQVLSAESGYVARTWCRSTTRRRRRSWSWSTL
jgi:transcriptional/translational regulatory protein YebC/TACO1